MEKAGGLFKNEKLQEKGAEKRAEAGAGGSGYGGTSGGSGGDSYGSGGDSYGSGNDNYGSGGRSGNY